MTHQRGSQPFLVRAARCRRSIVFMLSGCGLFAPLVNAQTVTLNLKNADISALISTVAEITGKNFIVDPRVKAKITVVSSKPMEKDEIYEVFLSILDVHSFAVIPSGGVFKIVPDTIAKQGPVPTIESASNNLGDQIATQVIQVNNVSAALLVSILRPLLPQQAHLAAYPATNMLVVSDRASNIERIVKIVQRIDKSSDSEIEVIGLQHAAAAEVARILTTLIKPSPERAGLGVGPAFVADERTNSILISGDRSVRVPIRAIVAHLDTPLESSGNTRVIYLRYAEAKELVNVLKGVGDTEAKDPGRSIGGGTGDINAGQAVAAAVAAAGQGFRAGGGGEQPFEILADETTNALIITASPAIMRSLESVIRQLDIRRAQVLVEAIIAEVSSDKAKQLGVQWIVDGSPGGEGPVGVINFSNAGTSIVSLATSIVSLNAGTGGVTGAPPISEGTSIGVGRFDDDNVNFAVLLQALASDGSTNILSTPSLMPLDNEEAEIVIGQNVPFVTGSFTGAGSGGTDTLTNPFQTIQREDVGLTLKIKPQINEGDSIKLDIEQEVSDLVASPVPTSDVVTSKRSIKTVVLVDDGRMVVLGGLIRDNLVETGARVPLLGDIPIIGELFRSRRTSKGKTNLMVFIRPVILRDNALNDHYSGGKYNYIRAQQLERQNNGVSLMPGETPPVLPDLQKLLNRPALSNETPPQTQAPDPNAAEVIALPPATTAPVTTPPETAPSSNDGTAAPPAASPTSNP